MATKRTVKFVVQQTCLNGDPFKRRIEEFPDRAAAINAVQKLLDEDSRDSYLVSREVYSEAKHISTTTIFCS